MLNFFRTLLPERSPLRLFYHKLSAIIAAIWWRFPSRKITVIGVTGTSGKSTTVELIQYLLQQSAGSTGSLSTIQFHMGDKTLPNKTFRTTLRPWVIQKMLRQMVKQKFEYVVIEVSSPAIDQNRIWGIDFDVAVLTNIFDNEHLDYHADFQEYVDTKRQLFTGLNTSYRKPNIPKVTVVNSDSHEADLFTEVTVDQTWTYAHRQSADVRAENVELSARGLAFGLRLPNNQVKLTASLIGLYNLENLLAAMTVCMSLGIDIKAVEPHLATLPGIPGRLEIITAQTDKASIIVDFSYKPSALKAVLETLKNITSGRLVVVWGGAGGRAESNWQASTRVIDQYADEFILTTDDPGDTDPQLIAETARAEVKRDEGEGFFAIEDRYEAIRYAIYTAAPEDTIIIAGRGHEAVQAIGKKRIPFDDREVAREILGLKEMRGGE